MLLVSLALIPVATAAGVEPWAVTIGLLVDLRRLVPAVPDVELHGGALRVRGSPLLPRAGSTLRRRLRGPHAPGPRAGRAVLAPPRRAVTAARDGPSPWNGARCGSRMSPPRVPGRYCRSAHVIVTKTDREPKITSLDDAALRQVKRIDVRTSTCPPTCSTTNVSGTTWSPTSPSRTRATRPLKMLEDMAADEIDAAVAWAPRETRARSTGSIPRCCGAGGTRQGSFALAPQEGGCTSQRVGLPESTSHANELTLRREDLIHGSTTSWWVSPWSATATRSPTSI